MTQDPSRFYDAIAHLVEASLINMFKGKSLSEVKHIEVYTGIYNCVLEVFQTSKVNNLSNEFMNFVAQQFYDEVVINEKETLDPNIFTQRAKLENITTHEVQFLAMFYKGTHLFPMIVAEAKRR